MKNAIMVQFTNSAKMPMESAELAQAAHAVLQAGTARALKQTTARLTATPTPTQLLNALLSTRKPWLHGAEELLRLVFGVGSARRKALAWQRVTLARLRNWPDAGRWTSRSVTEHATLFTQGGERKEADNLIVGFSGNSHLLMVPTYRIVQALGSQQTDILILRDPAKKFYASGIEGMGDGPTGVAEFVARFAKNAGYRKVMSIGTSAGGLACILVALVNGWERAVMVGGDEISNHPRYASDLKKLAQSSRNTEIRLCFSQRNARDRQAVDQITFLFPETKVFPQDDVKDHNLMEFIDTNGDLVGWLRDRVLF